MGFFQAVAMSVLLYICTASAKKKRLEKKLDGNYKRMFRVAMKKFWMLHL